MKKINSVKDLTFSQLDNIIQEISKEKPAFQNEQEFQFELAWKIREKSDENIGVKLEYHYKEENKTQKESKGINNYIDIVIFDKVGKRNAIAIEIKHKVKIYEKNYTQIEFKTKDGVDEKIELVEHGAYDHGSYYFIRDISRLENLISKNDEKLNFIKRYAILLTNEPRYWEGLTKGTYFYEFSIGNQIDKNKKCKYKKDKNNKLILDKNNTKFPPLEIKNCYNEKNKKLKWNEFSKWILDDSTYKKLVDDEKSADFEYKYLIVEIK